MELFDFINVIFTNPGEYSSATAGEKRKHYFMCQRRFAINFPLQANALQHLKINQSAVIDFWQYFLRKKYSFVPKWMYTKGVKKSQEIKEKKQNISNDVIKEYCKYMKLDYKTVYDALEFYPNDMIRELQEFEKIIKQK
jgi:hypothetical protein